MDTVHAVYAETPSFAVLTIISISNLHGEEEPEGEKR